MGFNYWALVASTWCINNFEIKNAISLGRQVIHIHDYDLEGDELYNWSVKSRFGTAEREPPFIDELYCTSNGLKLDSIDYSDYENATHISDLSQSNEHFLECGVTKIEYLTLEPLSTLNPLQFY